ncbi:hypothetical protein EJB05_13896, partial [Eragrostis curvula]
MAQIGGEIAIKRRNPSSSGKDRLSTLPDDILVLILLRLETISEAARTSVLSLRWRLIWTLLPNLTFNLAPNYRHVPEVLVAPEVPALRCIFVVTKGDAPNSEHDEDDEVEVEGAIPLPCFGNATRIRLDLGFLTLSLPSSGAFKRLTELCLKNVRASIGVNINRRRTPEQAFKFFKRSLNVPFHMEIVTLMSWCIWTSRNDWLFSDIDPTVEDCKRKFVREFKLLLHRAKKKYFPQIEEWLQNLA